MPFGKYADFAECVADNQDKASPEGFCAWLHYKTTGNWPSEASKRIIEEAKAMAKTSTFRDVEIARAGTFEAQTGRVTFTTKDFEEAERACKELEGKHDAPIKLGHDEHQKLLQEDGYPNAGFVENVRRKGNKLLADLVDVPEVVAELIRNGRYNARSLEAMRNLEITGKKWPFVITGLALLGAELPAVDSLRDVAAVYASHGIDLPENAVIVMMSQRVEAQGNIDALVSSWDSWAGSFTKCVDVLSGKPGITDPKALCAWIEHEATGKWPAEAEHKASEGGEDVEGLLNEFQTLLTKIESTIYRRGGAPKFRALEKAALDELRTITRSKIKGGKDMELAKLITLLGLAENATEEAIEASINSLKQKAEGEKDALKADLAEAQKRIIALEGANASEKATRSVDEAIKAGKFAPASRDTLIKMATGSPTEFGELVASTPENAIMGKEKGHDGSGGELGDLEPTVKELEYGLKMGLTREELIKQKAEDMGKEIPEDVAKVLAARKK